MDWTRAETIRPNGVNQLEVIGHGSHFVFIINGQIVAEVEDDHFRQGTIGLGIAGYSKGEKLVFDFLDITLRSLRGKDFAP